MESRKASMKDYGSNLIIAFCYYIIYFHGELGTVNASKKS